MNNDITRVYQALRKMFPLVPAVQCLKQARESVALAEKLFWDNYERKKRPVL